MNELSTRVADPRAVPALPEWLDKAVDRFLDPEWRSYLRPMEREQRQAAEFGARRFDEMLAVTIARPTLEAWLEPLVTAVKNPPPEDQYDGRIEAIMRAAGALPLAVLGPVTQAEALKTFKFWPSAAELLELLEKEARRLQVRRDALHALAKPPAPRGDRPQPRTPPSDAEKDHVARVVSAFAAGARGAGPGAGDPPPPKPEVKAKPLADAQLIALYEQQARSGDKFVAENAERRLKALRAKVASGQGERP